MSSSQLPIQYTLGTAATGGTALSGVTTGTGRSIQILGGSQDITVTFTSIGTTSGGTIIIEETDALDDGTGATWSQILSQAASGFTGTVKLCVHTRIGAGGWVRGRISSNITGGGSILVSIIGS